MHDYIMLLRSKIGHMPIVLCGTSVIVENDKGEILLQLRRDNHCWGYAGGIVEIDEAVEDAAKRELYEETGLIANHLELFGVFSGKDCHYTYSNGDEVSIIDIVYICKDYSGQLCPQESEVEMLQFFSINEIPEKISPPITKAIKAYVASRIDSQWRLHVDK